MARNPNPHPTDAELEILRVLWSNGSSTIGQICSTIRESREVATTTVATVLKVMHGKKQVTRKKTKQGYVWAAKSEQSQTASGMLRTLMDRLFDGSAHQLVAHLVQSGELSDAERQQVRELLNESSKTNKQRSSRSGGLS